MGPGARPRGFAVGFTRRFMRGRAAGSSHRCFPRAAWGLLEAALSTNPPLRGGEGNPPSPDGSGSGGASREAAGKKEQGKGPAAPWQRSFPFPISRSDVAGHRPCPCVPLSPLRSGCAAPVPYQGTEGRGRHWRRCPRSCKVFASSPA